MPAEVRVKYLQVGASGPFKRGYAKERVWIVCNSNNVDWYKEDVDSQFKKPEVEDQPRSYRKK